MSNTPHEHNMKKINEMTPLFRYGNTGSEPFFAWKARALKQLNALLGLPLTHCGDGFVIEYETHHEAFTEIRFKFQSEPEYYVPCHLLIPAGASKP